MAAKLTDAQRNHAIELYLSGLSAAKIAPTIGCCSGKISVIIKEAGVVRTLSDARNQHFKRGGKASVVRDDISTDEVLRRYAAGESANQIAHAFGSCHDAIRTRIQRAGMSYRDVAKAAPLRNYNQMMTGVAKTKTRKVGAGEDVMANWLRERGEIPYPQHAVGTRNIDIAIAPIAVEIMISADHPFRTEKYRVRTKELLDRGWWCCYVLVAPRTRILLPTVADQIVALAQFARSNPSAPREHWVIRGCGERASTSGDDINNRSLIPPSVDCPHHRGVDYGISR